MGKESIIHDLQETFNTFETIGNQPDPSVFKDDESLLIRSEVARLGYALDELKNDDSFLVRLEVVKQGFAVDELLKDSSPVVREAAAEIKERLLNESNK